MRRDLFLKFSAIFLPKFVDITYKTKSRVIQYIIELRLLEYCWQPDPNLEFLQLQAHSNFGGIYRLPNGRDEFNVFPGQTLKLNVNTILMRYYIWHCLCVPLLQVGYWLSLINLKVTGWILAWLFNSISLFTSSGVHTGLLWYYCYFYYTSTYVKY